MNMRISRSTGYGILALGYIAQHLDEKIILSQSIAKEYNIPLEYLLKIMQQLVRANILRSKRGPRGGFSMARPANKISFLQIIEAVDGPMVGNLDLAEQTNKAKFGGKAEKIYTQAVDAARNVFEKKKLSDIL
jgi:Rrf2 family protein